MKAKKKKETGKKIFFAKTVKGVNTVPSQC